MVLEESTANQDRSHQGAFKSRLIFANYSRHSATVRWNQGLRQDNVEISSRDIRRRTILQYYGVCRSRIICETHC